MRTLALLVLWLLLALLAACGGRPVVGGERNNADATMDAGPSCSAGQSLCAGRCTDTQSDRVNCGACGNACPAGQVCVAGACQTACPEGQAVCAGACVTLATDRANCGACGNACPAGQVCAMGVCALACGQRLARCGGGDGGTGGEAFCADTQTDRANCGACGNACPAGHVCVMGRCELSCMAGLTDCGGSCRDLQTDRANCGACGNACAAGEVCVAGRCELSCPMGQVACGGFCVFTASDPANCGACGNACPARANAAAVCAAGACNFVCSPGFADCDRMAASGCEANLNTDTAHCGACGNACPARANATPACTGGVCGFTCNTGFGDCDGNATNGCETNTQTSVAHCGACGNACPARANATPTCAAGACGFTCNTGFADCDRDPANGCEVNLNTSSTNCGACGNVCPGGGMCFSGSCTPRCNTAPARVLIYGPGGTSSQPFFPPGTMVTVASDAMWRSMTTTNFGDYDVIWVDGNHCSSDTTVFTTLRDTQAVWGPAVRGRVAINPADPDLHAPGNPGAARYISNHVRWLAQLGRNNAGGRTSMYFSWGCSLGRPISSGAPTPTDFQATFGMPITFLTSGTEPQSFTAAGMGHPLFAGLSLSSLSWGIYCHGGFPTIPTGFTSLLNCTTGTNSGLFVREMACVP